ncbi:MAG: hypothetical protein ACLP2F_08430 [Steroidobacteraceae bacterium]
MPPAAPKLRIAPYFALNISFLFILAIAYGIGGSPNPRFLHLILLFALCSTSVIDFNGLNGRHALLAIFLLAYFVYFGLGDLSDIVHGTITDFSESALSRTEAVILVGGLLLVLGYRVAVSIGNGGRPRSSPRDWGVHTILLTGLPLWAIGTYATYTWYIHVVTDVTLEATRAGIARLSPLATIAFILAQMMQPLGVLLIAYAWRVSRSSYLFFVVVGIVTVQVILGFIIDIKGVAMMGGILVIATCVLVDGRIPKAWLAASAVFVLLAFPIFQAYRAEIHGTRGIARTTVVENLWKTLQLAISAEEKVNTGTHRAQTFFERLSLKASVQMIVDKTGYEVPFQHGYTLTPILSTFLPRILWSDKPDIPTGQIVNKVFHVTEQEETYISPSHLGELYWNFGWPGVVIGMPIIGLLCGAVARFNLFEARTVTRLLVTVLTIQQVIHGFEGSIAAAYVVWLRSLAAVALLHFAFARVPLPRLIAISARSEKNRLPSDAPPEVKRFPNLLS